MLLSLCQGIQTYASLGAVLATWQELESCSLNLLNVMQVRPASSRFTSVQPLGIAGHAQFSTFIHVCQDHVLSHHIEDKGSPRLCWECICPMGWTLGIFAVFRWDYKAFK